MTIYGLIFIGLAIVASIPLGLGWLVLAPVMAGSWYAGGGRRSTPEGGGIYDPRSPFFMSNVTSPNDSRVLHALRVIALACSACATFALSSGVIVR